jgi:hypothetical protein
MPQHTRMSPTIILGPGCCSRELIIVYLAGVVLGRALGGLERASLAA